MNAASPSPYVYHDIYVGNDNSIYLVVGELILKIRGASHRRVKNITNVIPTHHWHDYVSLTVIQNVYAILDRHFKLDNVVNIIGF